MLWMQALMQGCRETTSGGSSCSQTLSRSNPIVSWWSSASAATAAVEGLQYYPHPHPTPTSVVLFSTSPGDTRIIYNVKFPEGVLDSPVSKTPSRDLPTFPRVTSPPVMNPWQKPSGTTCVTAQKISQQVAKNHTSRWIFKEPAAEQSDTSGPFWPFLGEESQQPGLMLVIILGRQWAWG